MADQVADSEKIEQSLDSEESVANGQEAQREDEQREPTVDELLQQAQDQAAENLEGWQRARAELANARKRFERQRAESYNNALVDITTQLLPVLDDFELAFANVPQEIEDNDWYSGLELIPRKLHNILQKLSIERIETIGEPFDPNFHSAVMREEHDEYDTDIVIKEFQAGYRIGDRVIRPAMVVVAA